MISINGKFYVDNSHKYDYNIIQGENDMSNRLFYAVLCITSLFLGGILYLLFRENTYISLPFEESSILLNVRNKVSFLENGFLKYYFPDLLWAFSLCFGLCWIFDPKIGGNIVCATISFIYGSMWEILQGLGVIGGTGDLADVVIYLVANIFAITIIIKRRKKNEKIN